MQKQPFTHQFILPPQSPSAIPIVAPDAVASTSSQTDTSNKPASKPKANVNAKRLCRNVIIHGFCKFEDKGCEFNHEVGIKPSSQPSPESKSTVRIQQPTSTSKPANAVSTVTPDSVNAPVFVPTSSSTAITQVTTTTEGNAVNPSASSGQNGYSSTNGDGSVSGLTNSFSHFSMTGEISGTASPMQQHPPMSSMGSMSMMQPGPVDPYYYMGASMFDQQPLQYHMHARTLPHLANLSTQQRALQSFFTPDQLREELARRNENELVTIPARELGLPQEVDVYHSLYPLEIRNQPGHKSMFFNHPTTAYKAVSTVDGRTYVLYRVEGFRLVNEQAMASVERWRKIRHSNIVSIREAFTTRAFGDPSVIFVYQYHPGAKTLLSMYGMGNRSANGSAPTFIPETTLWSYITQIASAMKKVHKAGLAVRSIEPSKILVTGKNRLRINCSAALDVLHFESGDGTIEEHQQEDFLAFGKLIIELACNIPQSSQNLPRSFELVSHCYSADIKKVVLYLLSKPDSTKNIDHVISLIGSRILHEVNCNQSYTDVLDHELSRQLENGRLLRLLTKMGFINERAEFENDPSWSETGEKYIIKLFRDYVFHQTDDNGSPRLDNAHVVSCLNKLDAGVDEKIMLTSRDDETSVIVSYKEAFLFSVSNLFTMSAELVWALVKNNNSFLVKRPNGVEFTAERGNLTNLNTFKYSGLANNKAVDIAAAPRGVRVTLKKAKQANKPAKSTHSYVIAKSRRASAKSVANLVARSGYRADLRKAALARASAVISSQAPKKAKAVRPAKGLRAEKAAAKQA
ncbi:poly-specific ribonuclease [Lichtheimia corymbifera JMRC:FSU:9682]|uniref:PAN2-PAN3 deadenylation complex subunit PAN3 n=1 Tax=Lichtheimia corymbifera JMRC:FSU:9682 TaxID=1263082 RepID=A0A068RWW7_9FUNG|nr:poly-specific ribonuclease [Lichtheimia corymbifera JMRC:FSU:9682]